MQKHQTSQLVSRKRKSRFGLSQECNKLANWKIRFKSPPANWQQNVSKRILLTTWHNNNIGKEREKQGK